MPEILYTSVVLMVRLMTFNAPNPSIDLYVRKSDILIGTTYNLGELDISKKETKSNLKETLKDILGDPEYNPHRILEEINDITRSIRKIMLQVPPRPSSPSIFHKLRILYFLALNPGSNRYNFSRELKIPHASTLKVVKELSSGGLIRVDEVKAARTGLPKVSYRITSFGLIPLIKLYLRPYFFPMPKELQFMVENIQKDFAKMAKNCKDLPFWTLFLRNWDLFEREKKIDRSIATEIVPWLIDASNSYFDEEVCSDILLILRGPDLGIHVGSVEERITSMYDRFHKVLIERMLDTWLKEARFSSKTELPEFIEAFFLDKDLEYLFTTKLIEYKKGLQEKLVTLERLEEYVSTRKRIS